MIENTAITQKWQLTFWGVRGSAPQCGADYQKVGGHTSCVSLTIGPSLIIFDAGTGMINLGNWVAKKGYKSATVLLSHLHLDHVVGLPFFAPLLQPTFSIDILSSGLESFGGVKTALSRLFVAPYFPLSLSEVSAEVTYHDFKMGSTFRLKDSIYISTILLNHPGGSIGYRVEALGKSVCYITDTAPIEGTALETFIQGADLLIYDATFTQSEFAKKPQWGHSTWNEAVRLCQQSQVKKLALFHHDPSHDDIFLSGLEKQAQAQFKAAFVARQGQNVSI